MSTESSGLLSTHRIPQLLQLWICLNVGLFDIKPVGNSLFSFQQFLPPPSVWEIEPETHTDRFPHNSLQNILFNSQKLIFNPNKRYNNLFLPAQERAMYYFVVLFRLIRVIDIVVIFIAQNVSHCQHQTRSDPTEHTCQLSGGTSKSGQSGT